MTDYNDIKANILKFRDQRNWRQFHDPKNLVDGLAIEAAELLEIFLWKTTQESHNLTKKELDHLKHEIADIFTFIVYLCEEFKIDLFKETAKKLLLNKKKYPVKKSKGKRNKYTEL